jgi:hypothetical protein
MGALISHCQGADGLLELADEALAILTRLETSPARTRLEALAEGIRQIALELPSELADAYHEGYAAAEAELSDCGGDDDGAVELLESVRTTLLEIEHGAADADKVRDLRIAIDRHVERPAS